MVNFSAGVADGVEAAFGEDGDVVRADGGVSAVGGGVWLALVGSGGLCSEELGATAFDGAPRVAAGEAVGISNRPRRCEAVGDEIGVDIGDAVAVGVTVASVRGALVASDVEVVGVVAIAVAVAVAVGALNALVGVAVSVV